MTFFYEKLLKPVLFRFDPERMHDLFTFSGRVAGAIPPVRWLLAGAYRYRHPMLRQTIAGIKFENPIGLSAGFDKDCKLMKVLPSVGFGYEEVGSITAEAYEGNKGPRLVRLPADGSLIVYYGLKNKGADVLREKLVKSDGKRRDFGFPIGVSVAKTNKEFASDEAKLDDWFTGIERLDGAGAYLTINLSCPNTYDTNNYCDPRLLEKLLARIDAGIEKGFSFTTPVFLKVTADLTAQQADEIIKLCYPRKYITGFIISNLVKDRSKLRLKSEKKLYEGHKGGLSGKVVQPYALALVRRFRKKGGKRFVLIGCGGIFTAKDAYAYIKAGASLVQLITGMIYGGPGTMKAINKGLVKLLKKDGYTNISEAVGVETR